MQQINNFLQPNILTCHQKVKFHFVYLQANRSNITMADPSYKPSTTITNLTEFISIQYPGVVVNVENMLHTLGGINLISETICDENRRMQLWFRPDDRFSKPVNGNRRISSALVMKVKVKKKTKQVVSYTVLGAVKEEFYFNTLCDFQYTAIADGVNIYKDIVPASLDTEWFTKKSPYFLVAPMFSRIDNPQSYYFSKDKVSETGQCSKVISSSRRKRFGLARFLSFEDTNVPTCPRKFPPNITVVMKASSDEEQKLLKKLFEDRPIFSRSALSAVSGISPKLLKVLIPSMAYHFNNGPWRAMWVRFGYDPRVDPVASIYQTLDFRFKKFDEDTNNTQARRKHRSSVIPRVAKKSGTSLVSVERDEHIFCPGKLPPYRQFFYQICDVHLPEVQSMLQTSELRTVCDPSDGWLPEGMAQAFRRIMTQYINEEAARRQADGGDQIFSEPSSSSDSDSDSNLNRS